MLNSIVLILSMKTEAVGVDCFSISLALEDSSLLPISTISKHNHKKHIESKYLRKGSNESQRELESVSLLLDSDQSFSEIS